MTNFASSAARNNVGSRALRAGPLSLLFDGGGLRYIRLGERELVRRVYCAVRDANWGTDPDRITAGPSAELELSFEGEVFETEDQRNWLDASFNTFCTPLSRPFPVDVSAGERITKRVTIDLHRDLRSFNPQPEAQAVSRGAVASVSGLNERSTNEIVLQVSSQPRDKGS